MTDVTARASNADSTEPQATPQRLEAGGGPADSREDSADESPAHSSSNPHTPPLPTEAQEGEGGNDDGDGVGHRGSLGDNGGEGPTGGRSSGREFVLSQEEQGVVEDYSGDARDGYDEGIPSPQQQNQQQEPVLTEEEPSLGEGSPSPSGGDDLRFEDANDDVAVPSFSVDHKAEEQSSSAEKEKRKAFLLSLPPKRIVPMPLHIEANTRQTLLFRVEIAPEGNVAFLLMPEDSVAPACEGDVRDPIWLPKAHASEQLLPVGAGHYLISVCPKHRIYSVHDFLGTGVFSTAVFPGTAASEDMSAGRSARGGPLQLTAYTNYDHCMVYCRFYDVKWVHPRECLCSAPQLFACGGNCCM